MNQEIEHSQVAGEPDDSALALRERGELLALRDALMEAERSDSLDDRLRAIASGVQQLGFEAAGVIVVSPTGGIELVVINEGARAGTEEVVRRARLASLDAPMDDAVPALAFPFAVTGGLPLARLVVVRSDVGYPTGREQSLRLFGTQAVRAVDDARIVNVAERRAARLQRLQEVGVLLSRLLDEQRIISELARHVQRVLTVRGVVVTQPDPDTATVHVAHHVEGGTSRPRGSEPLRPGIISDVAKSGRIVHVRPHDDAAHSAIADLIAGDATGVRALLAVPMLSQHRLVGVVAVYTNADAGFSGEDEELLSTIAAQAAAAIVNARLFEESQRERRLSEALAEIARAVGGSLRVNDVLQLIQRHAVALFGARGALVAIRKDKFLHVVAATGSGQVLAGMYLPIDASIAGRAVLTAQPVLTNDVRSAEDVYGPARDLATVERSLIAPLISEDGPMGALAVLDREEPFTEADAVVLQRFADHVAIALVNARLYEEAAGATRQLGETFDAIAAGLVVVNASGAVVRCNARAVALLSGSDARVLTGKSFMSLLVGDAPGIDASPVARALDDRTVARGTVHDAATGITYGLTVAPHPAGGAVILFDDVSSSQQLIDRFRSLLTSDAQGCCAVDHAGTITAINDAGAAFFERSPEAVIGRTVASLAEPADAENVTRILAGAAHGSAGNAEFRIVTPAGARRRVALSAIAMGEPGGAPGVLAIMTAVQAGHGADRPA